MLTIQRDDCFFQEGKACASLDEQVVQTATTPHLLLLISPPESSNKIMPWAASRGSVAMNGLANLQYKECLFSFFFHFLVLQHWFEFGFLLDWLSLKASLPCYLTHSFEED